MGATYVVTTGLKTVIENARRQRQELTSGHTHEAAAATLHKRHGWEVGVPAHLVATFVGVARVRPKHFVQDVIAGAAISEATGWILTSRKNARYSGCWACMAA
jgi:membrane-associated phospholipid phosphatase